ncbi:MAG: thioredoxin domain-containing protein [bacterium]
MKRMMVWFATLVVVASLGCKGSNSDATSADAKTQASAQAVGATNGEPKPAAQAAEDPNAPGPDIYPGFNFGVLNATERTRFVDIAKAELCPCPSSASSLHDCLQNEKARCSSAEQVATIVAMGIKQGLTQSDVMGQVADFIEESKKTYEFDLKSAPFRGSPNAKVVFVEFADFQCPHCREAGKVFSEIEEKYGSKIAVYYKHFPLGAHPEARYAAEAAVAAHNQGKFWPMHDLIFENQMTLSKEKIDSFARQIGLNFEKFKKDMVNPETIGRVEADRAEGEKANLTGTPTIFLNGVRYQGERSVEAISAAIDSALESAETTK